MRFLVTQNETDNYNATHWHIELLFTHHTELLFISNINYRVYRALILGDILGTLNYYVLVHHFVWQLL